MVRTIHISLDDRDYKKLEKVKDGMTWTEFILTLLHDNNEKEGGK